MTNSELKDALMDGRKVVFGGIEYDRVNAIIYRQKDGGIDVTAELLDRHQNCVVIASPVKIQEAT